MLISHSNYIFYCLSSSILLLKHSSPKILIIYITQFYSLFYLTCKPPFCSFPFLLQKSIVVFTRAIRGSLQTAFILVISWTKSKKNYCDLYLHLCRTFLYNRCLTLSHRNIFLSRKFDSAFARFSSLSESRNIFDFCSLYACKIVVIIYISLAIAVSIIY